MSPPDPSTGSREPDSLGWAELVFFCANNSEDSAYWREFLRRYGPKIKHFIRGTWRLSISSRYPLKDVLMGGVQENDLFQSVIVRLVEQDFAAMKRFSGRTEEEWLAYLAIISRSVVRDALRRQRRQKRPDLLSASLPDGREVRPLQPHQEVLVPLKMERTILARELRSMCEEAIPELDRQSSERNMLIFRLYFDHDLSPNQIAGCEGVNLSRTGVENVIYRLKDHIRGLVSQASDEAGKE